MRLLLVLCLCTAALFGQDVIFRGTPTLRVTSGIERDERQKVEGEEARKGECLIVRKGKKYFWASRQNAPLNRIETENFTYFVHTGGSGYVKVFTGDRASANLPVDYVEHISQSFNVITYWGTTSSSALQSRR
jgi:hypothetical protein